MGDCKVAHFVFYSLLFPFLFPNKYTISAYFSFKKLYQVLGADFPLKYSTLKSKGIPDGNILFVVERDEFRRELNETKEREAVEKEAKERQRQDYKTPF